MSCVSELVLQISRGCTTSVVPHGDPLVPPHDRTACFAWTATSPNTTFRKFLHWARPILRHLPFSVHGFYTSVSTIPNFLAAFFSWIRLSSLGRLYWTVETATFGMTQILMPHSHVHFRNDSVSMYGLISLMVIWLGSTFFLQAKGSQVLDLPPSSQCMNFLKVVWVELLFMQNTPYAHVEEQRSSRGTTLVVQPLEICNTNSETQDTRY